MMPPIEGSSVSSVAPTQPAPVLDTGFADATRGTEPQWELDTQLADIANDAYHKPGDPIGPWTRLDDSALADIGIVPTARDGADIALVDSDSGFQAAVYADGEGRIVVAFAGTDPFSGKDWLNNVQQGVGLNSEQYDQAIALGQQVVQAYGADNVVFAGHSLGGGQASAAALATDTAAVTFNAAGVGPETLRQLGLSSQEASLQASEGQIRRYNVENDPLTKAQQTDLPLPGGVRVDLPEALGYEITLENPNTSENAFQAHGGGTVASAMESRDIKTQQNDNWFKKNILEHNLVPMGPSLSDIGQTTGDAAVWTFDNVLVPGARGALEVVDETVDFAVDRYEDGREIVDDAVDYAADRYQDAEDAVENTVDYAADRLEDGKEIVGDVVDDTIENADPRNWNWPG